MPQKLTLIRPSNVEFVKRIGFSLWQKGDYQESRAVVTEALNEDKGMGTEDRVALYILWCMDERSLGNFDEALKIHREARPLLDDCADIALSAKFLNGLAITYRKLKRFDEALEQYTAVRVLMEEAEDSEGYAKAGNNIANVLVDAGNPSDAHQYLNAAMTVCTDKTIRSQILNTRARALAAEGKTEEAKRAALESVGLSIGGDEDALAYEHLATLFEVSGVTLDVEKLKHAIEAEEIRRALVDAKGSVYRAAPKLHLTCEGLRYKLEHQHRDLLYLRNPQRRSPVMK